MELKKDDSEDLLVSEGGDAVAVGSTIAESVLLGNTLDNAVESGTAVLKFAIPLLDIVEEGDQDRVASSKGNVVLLTVRMVVDGVTSVVDGPVTVTKAVLVMRTWEAQPTVPLICKASEGSLRPPETTARLQIGGIPGHCLILN